MWGGPLLVARKRSDTASRASRGGICRQRRKRRTQASESAWHQHRRYDLRDATSPHSLCREMLGQVLQQALELPNLLCMVLLPELALRAVRPGAGDAPQVEVCCRRRKGEEKKEGQDGHEDAGDGAVWQRQGRRRHRGQKFSSSDAAHSAQEDSRRRHCSRHGELRLYPRRRANRKGRERASSSPMALSMSLCLQLSSLTRPGGAPSDVRLIGPPFAAKRSAPSSSRAQRIRNTSPFLCKPNHSWRASIQPCVASSRTCIVDH